MNGRERRISYFVRAAEWQGTTWRVVGETGLGPLKIGDEFAGVYHQDDGTEVLSSLVLQGVDGRTLVLEGDGGLQLRDQDILFGEQEGASSEPPACPAATRNDDPDQQEHAQPGAGQPTLCGIPASDVTLLRHLFTGSNPKDCPTCSIRIWNVRN